MQKFEFSLHPVLKVKKLREKDAQRELARAQQIFSDAKDQLEKIILEEKDALQRIGQCQVEAFEPAKISQLYKSLEGVRKKRIKQERYLISLAEVVREKRAVLRQRSNEKKVFEELEKKEREEYVREGNRQEQKFYDDLSAINHSQKKD